MTQYFDSSPHLLDLYNDILFPLPQLFNAYSLHPCTHAAKSPYFSTRSTSMARCLYIELCVPVDSCLLL
jgi:hypothetical protein